ncbi:unannotated protein [freshwater metagenome]|uniref:Unannotated protein n=1 Tax=freshwater metagenome TaxID=449393 RepID=A0A6J7TJX5_9ZZZZ
MGHDDPRTRDLVARSILENGPSSAAVLANRLGLTPAGIRRHLDALSHDGIVEGREPRTGASNISRGRGRPSKVFLMTDNGRTKFEHSYDDLAVSALKFLAEENGEASIDAFARRRGDEMLRTLTAGKGANSLETLASALSAQGYAATVLARENGDELCQHHCPIAHVASEFPQLCEAETETLSQLLGTHVQRLATIAHGDGVCTTYIPRLQNKSTTGGKR